MRKLALSTVYLLAFLAVLHVGLRHFFVNKVLAREYPIQRDRDYWKQDGIRMLLVGNSHVQLNIAPIDGTYNLASFDESYATTYYRLRDVLEHTDQPIRYVLMHLGMHSLRSLRDIDTQQLYWAQIIDYPDLIETTGAAWQYGNDAVRYQLFPYTGTTERLLRYFKPVSPKSLEAQLNFYASDFSQATDQSSQAIIRAHGLSKADRPIDETTIEYFDRILSLCSLHDIQVILVRFPVTRIHHEKIGEVVDLNQWQKAVDAQLAKHDNVEVIDFMKLYFDDYSKFMDSIHLNMQSKGGFTDSLIDELKKRRILPAGPAAAPE